MERRPVGKPIVRPAVEREVDEEVAFHVEMRVRELIAGGMAPDEARAKAIRGFGDVKRVKVRLRRLGRRRDEAKRRRQWWEDARQDLVFMVVWQGMRLVLVGVAVGVAAALGLSRPIAVFLYGVQAWDPLVFVSVPLLLGAVALLAVWWPARRASRVDPLVAIRFE